MSNRGKHSVVALKIKQGHRVVERVLGPNDSITIGRNPRNDIVVYGDDYPRSQTLLKCGKHACDLFLTPRISGDVTYQNSTLNLEDLITHDILPRKGNQYHLSLGHGRSGKLRVGDALVAFAYQKSRHTDLAADEPGYSWGKDLAKALGKDLPFKLAFLALFVLELAFAWKIQNTELPPQKPPKAHEVPKRFAKFVVQAEPEPVPAEISTGTSGGVSETTEVGSSSDSQESEQRERQRRTGGAGGGESERNVTGQGLLGLIGGTGASRSGNTAADFLVDQGLVQELDQLLGQTPLKKGRGYGRGSGDGIGDGAQNDADVDDLMDMGLSGGIDDLLTDVQGVQGVDLEKKGQVKVERPGRIRGSEQAVGQRSPQAVMGVINGQHGRVMYTYNKYLRQNPNLRGKVSFDVTIQANGRVSSVALVESTLNNDNFIRDLRNILRRMTFETIAEGTVTVNVPFVFNRAG
jgi:outer membrane biosynthesis protein TonB